MPTLFNGLLPLSTKPVVFPLSCRHVKQRADAEAAARRVAEDELARLRALLAEKGVGEGAHCAPFRGLESGAAFGIAYWPVG